MMEPVTKVAVIGSGAAGLITAHVLKQDGFDVQVLTRDKTPGGVWSEERVYEGLTINNVHGEFRFSPLSMPPPAESAKTGGRLTGQDMRQYMQTFADLFLNGNIRYETTVNQISRIDDIWHISVNTGEVLTFSKVVLCTGGFDSPKMPATLSQDAADEVAFKGPVVHSRHFATSFHKILEKIGPASHSNEAETVVVVGGGKSAQDAATFLANHGRRVTVVFEKADAFLAVSKPLPDFIRKSRRRLEFFESESSQIMA